MSSSQSTIAHVDEKPQWAAVWSLGIGVASLSTTEMLPASLLNPIAHGLHVSLGAAGQSVTVAAFVALITSLLVAPTIKSLDRRIVLLCLSVLQVLSNIGVALAPTMAVVLLARVFLGIAVGGFWALSASLAMRLVPSHHLPRALSIIFGGGALAGVVAAPLGSFLGSIVGWRGVFAAAAAVAASAFLGQLFTLPRMPAKGQTKLSDLIAVIRNRQVAIGMVGVVLMFGGAQCFGTYVRPFLQGVTHVGVSGVSLALLLLGVANYLGTSFAAKFLHRSIRNVMSTVSVAMSLVATGLFFFGNHALAMFLLITLWGLLRGVVPVGWSTWLTRVVPDRAESGGGILVAVIQIAIMAAAALGGLFVNSFGPRSIVVLSGGLLLVGAMHVRLALLHHRSVTS